MPWAKIKFVQLKSKFDWFIFGALVLGRKFTFFPKCLGLCVEEMLCLKILGQYCDVKFFKRNDIKHKASSTVENEHGKSFKDKKRRN